MALQVTYPGVYVQELPSGTHDISGVATAITAFVGYVRRGPINSPVQCFSFGDFQRAFGGFDPESPLSFQVSQFFLNGGGEAWVSRLVSTDVPVAQPAVTIQGAALAPISGTAPPSGADILPLQSANPGSWGTNMLVTLGYGSAQRNHFDLTAALYSGTTLVEVESLTGVTLDPTGPNYLGDAIAERPSALLAAPDLLTSAASPVPFASGTILAFGQPAQGVTLTVTVIPPGRVAPLVCVVPALFDVTTAADLAAALHAALSTAASALGLPQLGGAKVQQCHDPMGKSSAPWLQVTIPSPDLADYRIAFSASAPGLFEPMLVNCQAYRLTARSSKTPDGAPPQGADIAGNATTRTGIYALDTVMLVNLITLPDLPGMDADNYLTATTVTLNYAEARLAFAVLDLPATIATPADAVTWTQTAPGTFGTGIISAATYFPQVQIPTPFATTPIALGPSGTMAGLYAATDMSRGVWKAPAGIDVALAGVQSLTYVMSDAENGTINPLGINALRTFPTYGNIAWGARTLASPNPADGDWKYVPVRRLALYVEQSLIQGLQWTVFEPNDDALWAQIRLAVNGFLHPLFLQGAFVGQTASAAYDVICDTSTTTADDIDKGVVNILVMFAPVSPAEFIVIRLQQMAGQPAS